MKKLSVFFSVITMAILSLFTSAAMAWVPGSPDCENFRSTHGYERDDCKQPVKDFDFKGLYNKAKAVVTGTANPTSTVNQNPTLKQEGNIQQDANLQQNGEQKIQATVDGSLNQSGSQVGKVDNKIGDVGNLKDVGNAKSDASLKDSGNSKLDNTVQIDGPQDNSVHKTENKVMVFSPVPVAALPPAITAGNVRLEKVGDCGPRYEFTAFKREHRISGLFSSESVKFETAHGKITGNSTLAFVTRTFTLEAPFNTTTVVVYGHQRYAAVETVSVSDGKSMALNAITERLGAGGGTSGTSSTSVGVIGDFLIECEYKKMEGKLEVVVTLNATAAAEAERFIPASGQVAKCTTPKCVCGKTNTGRVVTAENKPGACQAALRAAGVATAEAVAEILVDGKPVASGTISAKAGETATAKIPMLKESLQPKK